MFEVDDGSCLSMNGRRISWGPGPPSPHLSIRFASISHSFSWLTTAYGSLSVSAPPQLPMGLPGMRVVQVAPPLTARSATGPNSTRG